MLDDILKRDDVKLLLKEICNNTQYILKDKTTSIDYENYVNKEKPLYIAIDALFKYKIIIEDIIFLDKYIESLSKLMKKINNFADIEDGINKLIGKTCARKLGIIDLNDHKSKEEILKYIYKKYIVEGYMFHSISCIYKDEIKVNGIKPEFYDNIYEKFIEVKRILSKNKADGIIEKTFEENYITMTDNFAKSYYYATNCPMFFSKLLSNNYILKEKKHKEDAYYRKDYNDCFNNLNKILNTLPLTIKEQTYIKKVCNEEWILLKNDINKPTIIMIKRSVIGNNYFQDIDKIIESSKDTDIGKLLNKLLSSRYDNVKVSNIIKPENIEFIQLFSYNDIYINKLTEKEVLQKNIGISDEKFINTNGKASILLIIGSILIILGVTISILMLGR